MKKCQLMKVFVQVVVFAFALTAIGCASHRVSSQQSTNSQNAIELDGNGVAQGTNETEAPTSKAKKTDDRRESSLIRVPHGRNKSP